MKTNPPGKKIALIAYITFIGMIVAYYMNRDKNFEFAHWHLKNMFGLFLLLIISQVTQAYINMEIGEVLWVLAFVLWIFSIIMASLNIKRAIPFFSEKFQHWFRFLD
ncbi:hypothetical protein [Ulvibacter antarcticus]|uniref:Import component protein n=1 Tax=Ulvibacter antarcticus TaxID=442714 RepID=A0A3L9YVG5_9FLAO|nr:hypothetical protein [Ulvibacter antarcticus]RMA64513.1 hypothetical protein BXY75_1389 [Ulvibacter antarcticus]